ncbi:MAG: hypothetical protein J0L75_03175 [Spirochaetes bacterium]|nr:hypothetical protein [Spirochaetota bacterium]
MAQRLLDSQRLEASLGPQRGPPPAASGAGGRAAVWVWISMGLVALALLALIARLLPAKKL